MRLPTKPCLARTLISASLLGAVLYGTDLGLLGRLIGSIDYAYALCMIAVSLADRALMAYKWRLLLRARGIEFSFWFSLKTYLISGLFGAVLPTSIGSDVFRAYYSSRSVQMDGIVASIVVERSVGVVASVTFALFGLILLAGLGFSWVPGADLVIVIAALLVLSAAGFCVSLDPRLFAYVERQLGRFVNHRLAQKLVRCHRAYTEYKEFRGVLLAFFFLSLFEQSLFAVMNYYAARALRLDVSLLYVIGIIPLCHIVMRLPISINAIGVQEGLYVFFFSQLGLSVTEAFSVALVIRSMWLLVHFGGAAVYLLDRAGPGVALEKAEVAGKYP